MIDPPAKYRLAAVGYLNTKPLLYGLLRHESLASQIDLRLDIPSRCAEMLLKDEVDLALVPVAILAELKDYHIVSDYCIGTEGKVATVCIYGDRPIDQMETIYLDYHSRTSVQLTRVLLRDHWELTPALLPAKPGYIKKIGGAVGGLVIGDRAIGLEHKFKYVYDLGEVWREHTGLPFVFAAWVARKAMSTDFVRPFNEALSYGIKRLHELTYLLQSPRPDFNLEKYFSENISYELDEKKRQALDLFLNRINANRLETEDLGLVHRRMA
ncbi:MAG: menaquinone biosynthesis protein [Bacteroidota bacterium]